MSTAPLARWRPDVANLNSQFASDVMNVLLAADDYIPFPKLVELTEALVGTVTGGFTARSLGGTIAIFGGVEDKLYKLNGTTLDWDNVSRLGSDSATTGDFASDINWTKGTGVTISGGKAHFTAVVNDQSLSQAQTIAAGTTYKVTFTVSGYLAGGVVPDFTGGSTVAGDTVTANGTYTQYLVGVTGNTTLAFVASDPAVSGENDSFTKVMLHMDGADAGTTFTDSNIGGSAHTWTATGNAQIDTADKEFGTGSLLCDGTGDYITTADHADFTLGSGAFSIDFWFKVAGGDGANLGVAGQNDNTAAAATSAWLFTRLATNILRFQISDGASLTAVNSLAQYSTGTNPGWHHVEATRSGNLLYLFIDGALQNVGGTAFSGAVPNSASVLGIGVRGAETTTVWNGWIDEFRLSVGVARHTADFTPATSAYRGNYTTLDIDNVTFQALANYGSTEDERWQFEQFGDYVVAVNINDNPQVFQLGVSSEFADLAGSPPRSRYVKAWGPFLALMNISAHENRVQWSALEDITGWTPGTANSDYQDFPDGGTVQGSSSATNPFIIMKRAIYAGTFIPGSSSIFAFTKIHDKRGAAAPYSIASRGAMTFFADSGGLFQLGGDGSIAPIGFEKIDRTIFGQVSGPNLAGMIGEIDPFFNRYYLAVKISSSTSVFDRMIIYDWNIGEFTQQTEVSGILLPMASGTLGYTLEGLSAISSSLDALPFSLDSKVWQGGAPVMAAISANKKLGFYSGVNAEATITTQEFGDTTGAVLRITETMPVIDTQSAVVSMGARMRRSADDVKVWSAERAQSTNTGVVKGNCRARYITLKMRVPEGVVWTHAQAISHNGVSAGMR